MKNFVQPGDVITLTAPANVLSGGVVNVGALIGVAAYDALQGAEVETQLTGVFELPATGPIDQGAAVYWDSDAAKVTATADSNVLIGAAVAAVGQSGTLCKVRLNGVVTA